MTHYVVLAQSEVTASALTGWLGLTARTGPTENIKFDQIVWKTAGATGEGAIRAYETLCDLVESAASNGAGHIALNDVVVLVDAVRPQNMNVVNPNAAWDSLIAMLVLVFPEIQWVFGACSSPPRDRKEIWDAIESEHSLSSLFNAAKRCPLYDPSGLRNWIRAITNTALEEVDDLQLVERKASAAAIDEERSYAYFHGYAAYRFGYKADVVMTWAMIEMLFGRSQTPHGYEIIFEDMSLNLPDRPHDTHLIRLAKRAEALPLLESKNGELENSKHRVLITTGQTRPNDTALGDNCIYLSEKAVGTADVVFKPSSGLFGFWHEAGLLRRKRRGGRRGDSPDFIWPPPPAQSHGTATGHGSPGKLLLLAQTLIDRAQRLDGNTRSVGIAVQGAVLATDALEIVGNRTPAISVEALYLKHRFEVRAECGFSGVEYHIDIRSRLKEVYREIYSVSQWFDRSERKNATLNAKMEVIYGISRVLRDHNRFEAEQICANRLRYLHHTLWMRRHWYRWSLWIILRYIEILLKSFGIFLFVLVLWISVLALCFWRVNSEYELLPGIIDAVSSFFSIGPPIAHSKTAIGKEILGGHITVACISIVSGFIHLGVFVSHLYAMVSRR